MKKSFVQFQKAFTLAEVLITLVIIGVIAAMTIPTAINNTKEQELKSQFKKVYSTITQAVNKTEMNDFYGYARCYMQNDLNSSSGNKQWVIDDCENFYKAFLKNLQVQKVCQGNSLSEGCIPKYQSYNTSSSCGRFNQNNIENNNFSYVLSDGQIIILYGTVSTAYPLFLVDINGHKGPNAYGIDLFSFYMAKEDDTSVYIHNSFVSGNACQFKVDKGRYTEEMIQYALIGKK